MEGPIDDGAGLAALEKLVPVGVGESVVVGEAVVGENCGLRRCSGKARGWAGGSSERSIRRSSSGSGTGGGGGRRGFGKELRVGLAIVVTRVAFVVSSEGGGGSAASKEALQRKHSPLPK